MKRIVVTGATSMIGVSIIEECLAREIEKVYAVVRSGSKNLLRLPYDERIKVIECDMAEYANIGKLIHESCDVFYHISWSASGSDRNESAAMQVDNIKATLDAVRAAKTLGCAKFVGAGSQAEYGDAAENPIGPQTHVDPARPYGIAKYAAGKLAMSEAKRLDIKCIWVRVFSVYGSNDRPSSMISSTIAKMKAGEKLSFTSAEQLWDYLHSSDAGRAFYLIGKRVNSSRVYCLGSGTAQPLRNYVVAIRDVIDPEAELGFGDLPYPGGRPLNLCADIDDLTADTEWRPVVTFEKGIRMMVCRGGASQLSSQS